MATSEVINAICSQLLTQDDLTISDELFTQIQTNEIIAKIELRKKGTSIRIFSLRQLYLSNITPILHNFGFTIIDEVTYTIEKGKTPIFINRFNLSLESVDLISTARVNIEQIIADALLGRVFTHCKIYSLVYRENITIREVALLRSFIEYINQALLSINYETILNTLTKYHSLSSLFIRYFKTKFDPQQTKRAALLKTLEGEIEDAIKAVPQIMDDKILKLTYALLKSMLRTNYYLGYETIAYKIDTAAYAENLKGLQPRIETFVFHPEFNGLHLRMSRISRGGLRWSDRFDDYRQEIKSLMITQEGKNSIIIPDGAKGGFVIHKPRNEITREYFESIYSMFINSLLDLVDNMQNAEIIRDERIVAYDGDDAYFVVAADKGTAEMSDVANAIALKRNFWLGDAFASGGSNGFGHKELGITAKGALMSTKRFFIEKGVNFYEEPISVVGIGSMKGDVFGNGMLESKAFKLLAAISHKEIFVDPDPDPLISYEERKRLFSAKDGSWAQYDPKLISAGGGIFYRTDKAITLSPEIKKMLGTSRKSLSGEELCRKLLCMKVDMLFNGGVGTYVKSSDESDLDLGDKQNEAVRVDASDLRATIVCEGGNLGFTQRARIEYAMNGGKINIDGIDNAAGVDTSDHEVNLKILLNTITVKGMIDVAQRDETLKTLTDQVVNLVLWSNYRQALAISRDEQLSIIYLNDFIAAIELLETNITAFNRRDFFIPKNENIHEVITKSGSIVRPVLCSLLSYSKIFVKTLLLRTPLIDEPFAMQYLYKYFPKSFVSVYEHEIINHPLKREIVATVIADQVINQQGATFISDFTHLGEERFLSKLKSYLVSNQLFGANDVRFELFRNDYTLAAAGQYKMLSEIEQALNFSTHWMVKYLDKNQIDEAHILTYRTQLFDLLDRLIDKETPKLLEGKESFNRFFKVIDHMRFAIAIITLKEDTHHSFENVAILFYNVIAEFKILEIIDSLDEIDITAPSDIKLRQQVLQYIEFILMHYTKNILQFQRIDETPNAAFMSYMANKKETFDDIKIQIESFMNKDVKDIKEITITVNQMMASAI